MPFSASETRAHLPCPLCGRSLLPVPSGSGVTFHCKSGHELAIADLLTAQSLSLKGGLEVLLAEWHRQHQTLIKIVEDARVNGYLDIAEIFRRHATSLHSRIEVLQGAFSNGDSSKLIRPVNPKESTSSTAESRLE